MPILSRLKSIRRSLRLFPPPRNQLVMSPELRRPPVRFLVSVNGLNGFLDLCFRGLTVHLEDQRVLVFLDGQAFLSDYRTANDLVCRLHYATSAAFSCRVRRRGARDVFFPLFSPSPSAALR